ncbi:helix-turn-helix domain-containing protein [Bhargavaea beijingensis]|uniref:DNA-binding protein n=1 Tax=Bhargavaea beijingensis TaxID=426756 RepID=A0ABX9ZD81_9BACL|nr:helix-turn-helix domain-containing protein [Bhargavaea beijingensis]RSK30969.1 DNA-binding protein [Bhargavaea beijingensis]
MLKASHQYYNAIEAAEILHVHPETVRRKLRTGEIKGIRQGREYVVTPEEVERLLAEQEPLPDRTQYHLQTVHSLLADERERIGEQLDHSTGRAFLALTERYKALGIAMQEVMHLMDQSSQDAHGDGEPS